MIKVVGIGPGHPDYLLPIAREYIQKAKRVIGGRRHIEGMKAYIRGEAVVLDMSEEGMIAQVGEALRDKDSLTVYLVSGDPMFYSLYAYIRRVVISMDESQVPEVIPGLSSLQYMFNRIGMPYEKATFISLHGRETSLVQALHNTSILGILTDREHHMSWIAGQLKKAGYSQATLWLGERLSYADECIREVDIDETEGIEADTLSVVIVDVQG